MPAPRYDVVVFGATSFVGQILCRYLLNEFGTLTAPGKRRLRWAIAGRSSTKLNELLATLKQSPDAVPMIIADAQDDAALRTLCEQTRVVVSTVGPYALYGDTVVKVCAETGTDYCDLTGEAHWVRKMITTNEAAALRSGARIVNCCGFDSIPSDLGTWYLQSQSQARFGNPCGVVSMRVKAMRGAASGGTVASMVNVIREATANPALRREYANPYSLCTQEPAAGVKRPRQRHVNSAQLDADFGVWVGPFVMAAINTRIVLRSNELLANAYGSDFQYNEGMMMGKGFAGRARAISFTAGLGAFVAGAALPPTRWLMEKTILPAPGDGPSPAAQERGFWDFRFVGKTATGETLRVKVTGDRDPGYGSTAKMLGEAAACLAFDVPKDKGGFFTPSACMAAPLMARLTAHAGVTFEVIS